MAGFWQSASPALLTQLIALTGSGMLRYLWLLMLTVEASSNCSSGHDCQLNGQCLNGTCHCEAAWRGQACQYLNLLPAKPTSGLQLPSGGGTWGGSVLFEQGSDQAEGQGTFHMFVSVFANDCGLDAWRPNSYIGRAISSTPEGPYTLTQTVKTHFAHEPAAVRTPDGAVLVYHIGGGDGSTGPDFARNCSKGSTGRDHVWTPGLTFYGPTAVLRSTSFSGPWTVAQLGNCSNLPGCSQCGDTNPAPVVLRDGTVRMMWRGSGKGQPNSVMFMAEAPAWDGPFKWNTTNLFPQFTNTHIEDAHMWISASGTWHALVHSDVEGSQKGAAGGHAFSEDGREWTFSKYNAYGATITMVDGSNTTFPKRERPHLIMDPVTGEPAFLVNGVAAVGFKKHGGKHGGCDRTFTFIQPIKKRSQQ